jgi:hypothetical protein
MNRASASTADKVRVRAISNAKSVGRHISGKCRFVSVHMANVALIDGDGAHFCRNEIILPGLS